MKNVLPLKFLLPVLAVIFCCSLTVNAADYYWVNGAGNWNDADHWSATSGGGTIGSIPGKNDNVIFDSNSLVNAFTSIQLSGHPKVNNFTFTASKYASFYGTSANLTIYGSLNIQTNAGFHLGEKLFFNNDTDTVNKINTNGIDFYTDLQFEQGEWELSNHLKTGQNNTIHFNSGRFYSKGYTVHAKSIYATLLDYELDFTNSHVSVIQNFDVSKATNLGSNTIYHILSDDVEWEDLGDFPAPSDEAKDAVVFCTGSSLELELLITSDYNGEDISCFDSCDGEITVNATGTPGPFSYRYGPSPNPFGEENVFDSLCVGSQSVTVIDSSNELIPGVFYSCTVSDDLNEPPVLSFDPPATVDPTCPDVCDGQAFTSPTGGTSPLEIFWPKAAKQRQTQLCCVWEKTP